MFWSYFIGFTALAVGIYGTSDLIRTTIKAPDVG